MNPGGQSARPTNNHRAGLENRAIELEGNDAEMQHPFMQARGLAGLSWVDEHVIAQEIYPMRSRDPTQRS